MSKQVFDPLVALQQKPEITNIPIVNIRFPGVAKKGEEVTELEEVPRQMVKIVHKRKGPEYRNQILERLKMNANLPFVKVAEEIRKKPAKIEEEKEEIKEEKEEMKEEEKKTDVPVKKVKRLVIKEPVKQPQEPLPELELGPEEDKDLKKLEEELEKKLIEAEEKQLEKEVEKESAHAPEPQPEKKKRGRKPQQKKVIEEEKEPIDLATSIIRTQKVADRLPQQRERIVIPTSNFYMNNRKLFIQKIGEMFKNYRQEILSDKEEITCDSFTSIKSFDLLTHQKIARDYLNLYTPYRGLLLYLGLGSGKCHKKDTPIMMYDGSIKMVQDILEGELLMGDDSTPRTVTSLARGKGKMYEVTYLNGDKYIVNDEHILCLKTENNANIIEISINDYLKLPQDEKKSLKGYKVPIEFPEEELPIDPYSIGYNLVDQTNGNVPMIYKRNSRKNRLQLLAGIIDRNHNGFIYETRFTIFQKDETHIDDIIYIARSLGFSCYKETSKYNSFIQISIFGKGIEEIPTKILYNNVICNHNNLLYDITVNYVGEDDYYGFTLDNNCRYVMGDFTVTHNTCTSIAIAEGMKTEKRIVVLTPASLKMNFFTELKKCGDLLYRRNQYWEFISIEGNPSYINILSTALSLPTEYIRKNGGAWLVNVNKEPNYADLSPEDQKSLDAQLDEMIRAKYVDINYNGLNMNRLKQLTDDLTKNPFDNSVVIIDEAHNFVSRIVNKLKKPNTIPYILYKFLLEAKNARIVLLTGTPIINYPNEVGILYNILRGYIKTWSFPINVKTSEKINTDTILEIFDKEKFKTYDYVDYAKNVLTITRNPFGFINMKKRGVIKGTIRAPRQPKKGGKKQTRKLRIKNNIKIEKDDKGDNNGDDEDETIMKDDIHMDDENINDYNKDENFVDHNYRVPPNIYEGGDGDAFIKYDGIYLNEAGNITDDEFQSRIIAILRKHNLEVQKGSIETFNYKALPDDPDQFFAEFINPDTAEFQRIDLFQRRILGLTSYYRSAQETLLPSFVKTEEGDNYHIEKTIMSPHQFSIYEKIRKEEADKERNAKKQKRMQKEGAQELYNISSTYRVFSRAACNFVFPPSIERPHPVMKGDATNEEIDENEFDVVPRKSRQDFDAFSSVEDEDQEASPMQPEEENKYEDRIKKALDEVAVKKEGSNESLYLSKTELPNYSPKFAKILENLQNPQNEGLHLLYSHFRTIEGIGILKLVLEANGFTEFKIHKVGDNWEWVEEESDVGKPNFVLYTGTETPEEKEIKRNIYNSSWDVIPANIATKLRQRAENNVFGEIIKIFMITSSGAEGINLKNTRFVHIVEPYWHMVRIDQVVGRARRICSHQDLPKEMQNVKVFLYITVLSEQQKKDEKNIELRIRDVSRIDKKTPVTTDETLYEIASIKQKTNNQILKAMKEAAIGC